VPDAAAVRRLAGRLLLGLLPIALFLGVWSLVSALGIWDEVFVPRPAAVWDRFVESVTIHDGRRGLSDHYLWEHLWASLRRILTGVGWAVVVGVPLGLLIATVRPVAVLLEPYVNFIRSLPPLAYFSLLIIWFGIEDTSKIWLLFLAAVAPIAVAVSTGARSVRRDQVHAARSLGASRTQVVVHTVLPSVLPDLMTGIRLAVGFAWTTIVAAETVDGIPGIGGLAWSTKKFQQTDVAVLCVLVIGATALVLDHLIRVVDRALVPWRGQA
jgi:taurine transport system permease protein